MPHVVMGIMAHVDAGKTTLAEAMLYRAGAIRNAGRVDHGNSHMDTNAMEQERGITIFSSEAQLQFGDLEITLVDTPGHTDFGGEAERVIPAIDYAILVVSATDGVQSHTRTLWRLLERYGIPAFIFINKTDLATADAKAVMAQIQRDLSMGCISFDAEQPSRGQMSQTGQSSQGQMPHLEENAHEACALTDETALNEFLENGELSLSTMKRLIASRKVFPCYSGSALSMEGVDNFLQGLATYTKEPVWPAEFSARVYNITHDPRGERLTWLKITGGSLKVKQSIEGEERGRAWAEKVNQIRSYSGTSFQTSPQADAGHTCAVTGLTKLHSGDTLESANASAGDNAGARINANAHTNAGKQPERIEATGHPTRIVAKPASNTPSLQPVLTYRITPTNTDEHKLFEALRMLEDEDPLLQVRWDERLQETRLQLMGDIQREVIARELADRFNMEVKFGPGSILYRETITKPFLGIGHFEPLRHYAEAHLLLEPLPQGTGVEFGSTCSTDDLELNWQRLIMTNAMEREHLGTLTGSPITDVRITVTAGKAHVKHTEGGDFRQATYRAIRQALMQARESGACQLLEPWYSFRLEVPQEQVGRALSDMQRMSARFGSPSTDGNRAIIEGAVPASEVGDYPIQVSAYTSGQGALSLEFLGYEPCHNAEQIIEEAAYNPEADLEHSPDSVFCSHGAGVTVKWHDVHEQAHVQGEPKHTTPWREANAEFFGSQ